MASLFTEARKTEMYQFFAVAFNAAPGVTFFTQLQQAVEAGLTTQQIVNEFTTKGEFLNRYPTFLSSQAFATSLVNNVARSSITDAAKANAVNDIVMALDAGLSRSQVIFNVFSNIAATTDPTSQYFGVAQQLRNEVNVARYYTEVQLSNSQDPAVLRQVLANVTNTTDTSSNAAIQTFLNNNGSGVAGQTVMLTASADARTGGAGPDTFVVQTDTHLAAFDTIDGGTSNDTLLFTDNLTAGGAPQAGAITDAQFQNVRSVEIIQASYATAGSTVSLGANAVAAGVNTVNLQGAAKTVNLAGFASALTVNGTALVETVNVSVADAGIKALNLGQGSDIVNVTHGAAAAAGSIQVNFVSASVGNGTDNNATIVNAAGNITVNDEGTLINSFNNTNVFNVVGLTADGTAVDPMQNRGNHAHVALLTSAADGTTAAPILTSAQGASGNVYINAGAGNDVLTADNAGDHFLVGGGGNDTLRINANGNTSVIAGGGDDLVFVNGTGTNNINLVSGTNVLTFTAGLQGTLNSLADTITGGSGMDTLRADSAQLTGYTTPLTRTISGLEVLAVTNAQAAGTTLTTATLQQGINIVNLEAGTAAGATVAFEAGTKTLNVGSAANTALNIAAGGVLGAGTLVVSAAGAATTDALTINNTNPGAVSAFAVGQAVGVIGFENLTINTGTSSTATLQTLGVVTLRGTNGTSGAAAGSGAAVISNTDALQLTLTGGNRVSITNLLANTDGIVTIDASALTQASSAGNPTFQIGALTIDVDQTVVAPIILGRANIIGSNFDDTITGSAGNDTINGGTGNDTIDGGAGNNLIDGGDGIDMLTGGADNDTINGGAGNDTIMTLAGVNVADGGDGNDAITGGAVNDTILGGAGNDTIDGAAGTNLIDSGAGNDAINVTATSTNTIVGGEGNDTITYSNAINAGAQVIDLGAGDDVVVINNTSLAAAATIVGGDGNDVVNLAGNAVNQILNVDAGNGDDNITGGTMADIISGGAGNDIIRGLGGNDVLSGGAGADRFVFENTAANNGADTISDLTVGAGNDVLDFSNFNIDGNGTSTAPVTLRAVDTVNPGAPVDVTGQIVRLVDIAASQDITTAGGLTTALAGGGEYANIDIGGAGSAIFITSATNGADVDFIFYATSVAGVITATLVGTTTNAVALGDYVAGNFLI